VELTCARDCFPWEWESYSGIVRQEYPMGISGTKSLGNVWEGANCPGIMYSPGKISGECLTKVSEGM